MVHSLRHKISHKERLEAPIHPIVSRDSSRCFQHHLQKNIGIVILGIGRIVNVDAYGYDGFGYDDSDRIEPNGKKPS